MNEFIFASQNQHKIDELSELLGEKFIIHKPSEKLNVPEDGESFQENALKKAKAYFEHFKKPAISDDSGLCLEAFPELLGLHSARFAPELSLYQDKCEKLLEMYKTEENKNAYFISVLCLYLSPSEIYFFEGRTQGKIASKLMGNDGFGYDPIFVPNHHPEKKSYAQDTIWKQSQGHRAKAAQSLSTFLKSRD